MFCGSTCLCIRGVLGTEAEGECVSDSWCFWSSMREDYARFLMKECTEHPTKVTGMCIVHCIHGHCKVKFDG